MSKLHGIGGTKTSHPLDSIEVDKTSTVWKLAVALFACLSLVLIIAYWPTAESIVTTWLRSQTFTHGILILPISGYMIWTRRQALSHVTPAPSFLGVAALAILGIIWLLGETADVLLIEQLALVAMIPALVVSMMGVQVAGMLAFPLAYLIFAVPFGEFLIPPLMDFTAWFAVKAIRLTGVPVFWEGRYIAMPASNWEVAEVCSGLRYLIASLAVGCLFAYLNYRTYWRRLAFIALATVVPIVANGLRAFGIIMIGHLSDMKLAVGVDHIIYGWIFFGVVILLLFWLGSLWREPADENPRTSTTSADAASGGSTQRQPSTKLITCVLVAAVVAMSVGPLMAVAIASDATRAVESTLILPTGAGKWSGPTETGDSWRPRFSGERQELHRVYLDDSAVVHVYVIHYQTQKQGSELIGSGNHIYDGKIWQRVADAPRTIRLPDGKSLHVIETILRSSAEKRLVWHWYDIAGRQTTSKIEGKLWAAWNRLVGSESGSSLVMVATDFEIRPDESRRTLERFLIENPPITRAGELVATTR